MLACVAAAHFRLDRHWTEKEKTKPADLPIVDAVVNDERVPEPRNSTASENKQNFFVQTKECLINDKKIEEPVS